MTGLDIVMNETEKIVLEKSGQQVSVYLEFSKIVWGI